MPNRMLRDWTCSENVDKLSTGAEVFFTRLIMKADDFGCYYGNPKLLKSNLFPLREMEAEEISDYIGELVEAKLLIYYEADGKRYVQIIDFNQRMRQKNSKFPLPEDGNSVNVRTNDRNAPLEEKRREEKGIEVEEEEKSETASGGHVVSLNQIDLEIQSVCPFFYDDDFKEIWKEWQGVRRRKKASTTKTAFNRSLKKLMKLSSGDKPTAIQILSASCDGGWSDIYEPKSNTNAKSDRTTQNASDSNERTRRLADDLLGEIHSGSGQSDK